jgi:opacity protein-like surface antigen
MKNSYNISAAGLSALAFLASPASAQDGDSSGGVYVSGSAGLVLSDDQLINGFTAAGAPRRIVTDMDKGSAFALALGYATKDADWGRFRTELEFAKQKADLRALSLNAVDRALIGEPDKSVKTGMFNIYYDTPAFVGPVRAEFGAGIGKSKMDYNIRYNVTATGPAIQILTNPSQGAYQLMAGLSGRVSGGLELFTQFRYLKVKDHKVERFNTTAGALDSVLDAEYSSKNVNIGLRYIF